MQNLALEIAAHEYDHVAYFGNKIAAAGAKAPPKPAVPSCPSLRPIPTLTLTQTLDRGLDPFAYPWFRSRFSVAVLFCQWLVKLFVS